MRTLLIVIALLTTYLTSSNAFAAKQGIAVDYLLGSDDIQGVRLAYRPYATQLTQIKWLGNLDIYWEVSMNFWEVGADNRHETNYAVALSPVFSKQFATIANKYPLRWEFGIGVSLVEDTRFAGKDIGSHYQFEDRLGLVTDFGENMNQSIALRYMHYSNGGLNTHNPGVDFLNVSYAVYF
ncbi:Lipid A deacylase PagL [Paraglaciecola mesophila]|uniref:Lipid A deacylase n=1 Tax=Paraglaciecola mesophila TaxID=197222 RepID=A0A857JIX0_9ALTE|nr:acyloxyacyl hydrolase [Paraglaciecola mesophila]QHJ11546.1 Lipid A deacylase PagL [Paraglaciecola mesophila]